MLCPAFSLTAGDTPTSHTWGRKRGETGMVTVLFGNFD
ncbi:Hypothetical protein CpCAP3W_02093 [Corynebacterium pseudotuberculosis]|nr:Hypothetical protein BFF96_2190 [Corynebacterium pseudotuberculosis]AUY57261.1 Hypothetical protein CpCAP3W_02093 [Corynebacterium pseudotuberculosis]